MRTWTRFELRRGREGEEATGVDDAYFFEIQVGRPRFVELHNMIFISYRTSGEGHCLYLGETAVIGIGVGRRVRHRATYRENSRGRCREPEALRSCDLALSEAR